MGTRLRSSTRASTAASTAASESLADTIPETKSSRGDSRKSSAAKPIRGNELIRLKRIAMFAFLAALCSMGGLYYLVTSEKLRLYPKSITEESLKGFSSRAEFALRYQALLYFWLMLNVLHVIYTRLTTKAINPLESTEKHAQGAKNILTNSFEQIVASSFLQLAFVSFAERACTLKLIPALNIVQFVGRLAFFAGYPLYRTYGFALTLVPNLILAGYNVYKLSLYMNLF